jgi:hypothetical protein
MGPTWCERSSRSAADDGHAARRFGITPGGRAWTAGRVGSHPSGRRFESCRAQSLTSTKRSVWLAPAVVPRQGARLGRREAGVRACCCRPHHQHAPPRPQLLPLGGAHLRSKRQWRSAARVAPRRVGELAPQALLVRRGGDVLVTHRGARPPRTGVHVRRTAYRRGLVDMDIGLSRRWWVSPRVSWRPSRCVCWVGKWSEPPTSSSRARSSLDPAVASPALGCRYPHVALTFSQSLTARSDAGCAIRGSEAPAWGSLMKSTSRCRWWCCTGASR